MLFRERSLLFGGSSIRIKCMAVGGSAKRPQRLPRLRQVTAGAGQNALRLLACRAGVHIDLHANRHFNDLWSFPSHLGLLSDGANTQHHLERKTAEGSAQVSCCLTLFQQS
jgi:hypothetical protein